MKCLFLFILTCFSEIKTIMSSYGEPVCSINEIWNQCPGYCTFDDTCEKLLFGLVPGCPAPPEDWKCTEGRCECAQGFVRIDTNCVEPSACCDDPNAELVQCPNPCPGGTCEQPEFSPCKAACRQWGCQCKKGYVKDKNGKCILITSCPQNCSSNEVWNPCPRYCTFDATCDSYMFGWIRDCTRPPPNWQCTGRCECATGYVRINGKCVKPSECCTDPNAELVDCPNPCPGGTCIQPEYSLCDARCYPHGCQCKKGYVKDINGKCILRTECPKCGPNEFFDCGSACDTTCATLGEICPIVNIKCVEQCYCVKGYARNKYNVCIPINECPPRFPCGSNEHYVPCPLPCPPDRTCDIVFSGNEPRCASFTTPTICKPACRCNTGYVRNNQNNCILPAGCCTDPNSQLVDNPNCCPGGTCAHPSFTPCRMMCPTKGCQCKLGFLKTNDTDATCINSRLCPTATSTTTR